MTEPSLATLAAPAALAAFVSGFLRASVGGGIGLALTPVLSLALPAQSALGLTGFMLNLADPFVLRYYWRQWGGRQLRLILPTALVDIVLGVWMIWHALLSPAQGDRRGGAGSCCAPARVHAREDPRGTSLGAWAAASAC